MPPALPTFAARLLAWFDAHRRDLPWRRRRDPWAIWVSEVMLQQTRVEAVLASYERFMRRFATAADFAAASDDELHAAWRGLGYYRRARLLRDGAAAVVRDHGGVVPDDVAALGELPGVGAYTAGAVASIAFGRRAPAIDGNVERVAARHQAIRSDVKARPAQTAIRDFVVAAQDADRPGDFNQALMELGALVCTPAMARCDQCPVAADCRGRRLGLQGDLPLRRRKPAPVAVAARVLLAHGRGGVFGHRLPTDAINGGQIELPGPGVLRDCAPDELAGELAARLGCRAEIGPVLGSIRHAITNHRVTVHVHAGRVGARGQLTTFAPGDPSVPWSTVSRKVFAAVLGAASTTEA